MIHFSNYNHRIVYIVGGAPVTVAHSVKYYVEQCAIHYHNMNMFQQLQKKSKPYWKLYTARF